MTGAAGIYSLMMGELGDAAWLTEFCDPRYRLIDVYHRYCAASDQERVTTEFTKSNSSIRRVVDVYHRSCAVVDQERVTAEFTKSDSNISCVVATISFGLGVDVYNVRYIIHWGCSKSLQQYWQETGRCCRKLMYLAQGALTT